MSQTTVESAIQTFLQNLDQFAVNDVTLADDSILTDKGRSRKAIIYPGDGEWDRRDRELSTGGDAWVEGDPIWGIELYFFEPYVKTIADTYTNWKTGFDAIINAIAKNTDLSGDVQDFWVERWSKPEDYLDINGNVLYLYNLFLLSAQEHYIPS